MYKPYCAHVVEVVENLHVDVHINADVDSYKGSCSAQSAVGTIVVPKNRGDSSRSGQVHQGSGSSSESEYGTADLSHVESTPYPVFKSGVAPRDVCLPSSVTETVNFAFGCC